MFRWSAMILACRSWPVPPDWLSYHWLWNCDYSQIVSLLSYQRAYCSSSEIVRIRRFFWLLMDDVNPFQKRIYADALNPAFGRRQKPRLKETKKSERMPTESGRTGDHVPICPLDLPDGPRYDRCHKQGRPQCWECPGHATHGEQPRRRNLTKGRRQADGKLAKNTPVHVDMLDADYGVMFVRVCFQE